MSFDLSDLGGLSDAQEAGIDISITHPKTGEPLDIVWRVAGPDSKRQKKARAAITNARIEKKIRKVTADMLESESIDQIAHATISFSGVVIEGKSIEFSVENAVMVLSKYPFIREQVQSVTDDRANFIKT